MHKFETTNIISSIASIKKRDGAITSFNEKKIESAIARAMASVGVLNTHSARRYARLVSIYIAEKFTDENIASVENIQDAVEKILIEAGEVRLVREYIAYRERRAQLRKEKELILEKDSLDEIDKSFDINSLQVLKSRYLKKDENGRLIETPKGLLERVAVHITIPTALYHPTFYSKKPIKESHGIQDFDAESFAGKVSFGAFPLNKFHLLALKSLYERLNAERHMKLRFDETLKEIQGIEIMLEKKVTYFFEMMSKKNFLPNTPALANFGKNLGMGSACFVLGVEDAMESIMQALTNAAFIFKAGGGVGYNFSQLRPEGDHVQSTSGIASGPLSFMRLFDTMTDVIKQGGIRRGANMGILNSNHPDIEKFIEAKKGNKALHNFNISVLLMDGFWEAYRTNGQYALTHEHGQKKARTVNARNLFNRIVYQAWESGEPGIIFHDRVNEFNPLKNVLGPIVTTNPCGEVLLYPYESCNLGSVNLHSFIKQNGLKKVIFDWEELKGAVIGGVEFLDNIIEVNRFPLPEIEAMTLKTRKIGLGVMGLADTLFALHIPYNGKEGIEFMSRVAEFIAYWSKVSSVELAKKRGPFPLFKESTYAHGELPFRGSVMNERWHHPWEELTEEIMKHGIRNAYTTVIAPTGSISMIAGTSSGIEPAFSLVYEKNVAVGSFYYIDEEFERAMREFGIYDERLFQEIIKHHGSLQNIQYIPPLIKKVFHVAHDLTPEDHIRALASFQEWVDSSISKTINFPSHATPEDLEKAYLLAYELGCKDVTVYRDGSIDNQVLNAPGGEKDKTKKEEFKGELGMKCPTCDILLVRGEGCMKCPQCGWGVCSS